MSSMSALKFIRDMRAAVLRVICPTPRRRQFRDPRQRCRVGNLQGQTVSEQARRYAAMVTMVDRHAGEISRCSRNSASTTTRSLLQRRQCGNDYFKSAEFRAACIPRTRIHRPASSIAYETTLYKAVCVFRSSHAGRAKSHPAV